MSYGKRVFQTRLVVVSAAAAASAVAVATGTPGVEGLAGPLFGLAAGRPNELLVADSSIGIIPIRRGRLGRPIALPGATDVSVADGNTLWALTGAIGAPPAGAQNDTGQGLHLISQGRVTKVANLFQFEASVNPHTAPPENAPDSNPYDVQALNRNAALVVDAGGNDLLRIDRWGNIKVLAVFPDEVVPTTNIKSLAECPPPDAPPPDPEDPPLPPFCGLPPQMPAQPVPTSIAVGRDGYIYVGELKGFPAPTGASNIWRVSPRADRAQCGISPDCVKVFDGGFTSIIDLAFGPDGLLYVTELDEASWASIEVIGTPAGGTISACNVKRGVCREVAGDLPQPTAIAFDHKGALWATQHSLEPGEGAVVRIRAGAPKWRPHPKFVAHD